MSRNGKSQPTAYRCEECGSQNYVIDKNEQREKRVLVKYCKKNRKRTKHKESRKLK